MTRITLFFFLLIPAILLGNFNKTYHFSKEDLVITPKSGYDQVQMKDFEQTARPGYPQMPFLVDHLLTNNQVIDSVLILMTNYHKIPGKFKLYPVQKPAILSRPVNSFQKQLLPSITLFPTTPVELLHAGKIDNQLINSLRIYPLQYDVRKQELSLLTDITLKFFTRSISISKSGDVLIPLNRKIIGQLAQSKQDLPTTHTNNDTQEYLIITSESMQPSFQPLVDWKFKKGLSAGMMTTELIDSLYDGSDLQEKIRNYIKESHINQSTAWILLGGDTNIIPDRKAWAFDCEADYAEGENDIPCDLYYSDLDGTWNEDGDNIFGEVEDSIDIYPDVFVGRAPVENAEEATAFVNKLLAYEQAVSRDYQTNMLFLAQVLWGNPYTDSGESKDFIDEQYVPAQFDPITKLYQSSNTVSTAGILDAINSGTNIINHNGHAWFSVMSVGNGWLGYNEMRNLTNQDKYGIMYSIGCWPAAFDRDAVAEDFLTNPTGGGVAFIGNSRYGWGSPGNPLFGYSDRFDQQFFRQLFHHDIHHIGATLAASKAHYAPLSGQENVYRWCQYEINLLGDPEMMIYTEIPKDLTLEYPKIISEGEQSFTISVTDESGPVSDCKVCLYQPGGLYFVGTSGADGILGFDQKTAPVSDRIFITATAHNHIPFQDSIMIKMDSPFLTPKNISHSGLFNGLPKIMQDITLSFELHNTGQDTAGAVTLSLAAGNSAIQLIDSIVASDILLPADSLLVSEGFKFQINDNFSHNDKFLFQMEIQDRLQRQWQHHFSITPKMPELIIKDFIIQREKLMPGDQTDCLMIIKNIGTGFCPNYDFELMETKDFEIINHRQYANGLAINHCDSIYLSLQLSESLDTSQYLSGKIAFTTEQGYQMSDSIHLSVGNFGLQENFEQPDFAQQWHFYDQKKNQWHRTSLRKNSGQYALYCGKEESQTYDPTISENRLETDWFHPGRAGQLRFYCWYEFPNYGTSGMSVDVYHDGEWDQLDFIGSGGALNALPTGNEWLQYCYDLTYLPDNEKTKLRFSVDIDAGEKATEGIYIDDIQVIDGAMNFTGLSSVISIPDNYCLYQNFPNPFNPATTIRFTLPAREKVKLSVFNLHGELVDVITERIYSAGDHQVIWTAKTLSSGIYFYKLEAGHYVAIKKSIYIK